MSTCGPWKCPQCGRSPDSYYLVWTGSGSEEGALLKPRNDGYQEMTEAEQTVSEQEVHHVKLFCDSEAGCGHEWWGYGGEGLD